MVSEHIIKSYDQELQRLDNIIAEMGGMAESQLAAAIEAVAKRDSELAARVVKSDARVDELEREVESLVVRLLALRQPLARDLRQIVAGLKIASDLERIADYAANVAKRAIALNQTPAVKPVSGIPRMGRLGSGMIKDVLDAGLPAEPYPPEVFDEKVQAVFDHLCASYGDDGRSVYEDGGPEIPAYVGTTTTVSVDEITAAVVERIKTDAEFAALVAKELRGVGATFARTIEQLIANDEDDAVEFKSTARWDLKEQKRNPAMEDAIVKTVAAFLNTDGGTLLIGVGPSGSLVGISHDYPHVKPQNADGFVNWLTTLLANALGAAAVMRTSTPCASAHGIQAREKPTTICAVAA